MLLREVLFYIKYFDVYIIGLDIPQVSLVINYDPPVTYEEMPQPDFDTYLHRMGRYILLFKLKYLFKNWTFWEAWNSYKFGRF